jgi:hypothetical protein
MEEHNATKGVFMSLQPIANAPAQQQFVKVNEPATDTDKAAPANPKVAEPKAQPKDSVQISSVAKQALQEATETQAQTAQEARGGDLQAKRLLAKEEAAAAAQQPTANPASAGIEKLLK